MCEGIEGYNCSILNPFEHYHHFFWRAQSLGDTETSYTSEETQNLIETPLWKMYMLIERVSISTLKTKERILGSFHLTECHAGLLAAAAAAKSLQSCPTLCNPVDGSPPGSPVPGILQARTLEWVAISFSSA